MPKNKCTIPMYPSDDSDDEREKENNSKPADEVNFDPAWIPSQQENQQNLQVQNQLQQAASLFASAKFANCNFTFNLQK